MPAIGDEEIRRLDVAMNDSFGMRSIESVGDLDAEVDQFATRADARRSLLSESCLPEIPSR